MQVQFLSSRKINRQNHKKVGNDPRTRPRHTARSECISGTYKGMVLHIRNVAIETSTSLFKSQASQSDGRFGSGVVRRNVRRREQRKEGKLMGARIFEIRVRVKSMSAGQLSGSFDLRYKVDSMLLRLANQKIRRPWRGGAFSSS